MPRGEGCFDTYLEAKPAPLVALVGLQHLHGALTSRVAGAADASSDELHARYVSLDVTTEFLDYVPAEMVTQHEALVVKHDWLHKHTHVVAAVVSLWCRWDSDASVVEIAGLVESFRSRLRPNCRIVLVLVTASDASPSSAQTLASPGPDDRLSALRKACEIDAKSIMLIPAGGDASSSSVDGSLRRLDRWLLDLAVAYYKDESRRNKKAASKKASPQLLARHHFKSAYAPRPSRRHHPPAPLRAAAACASSPRPRRIADAARSYYSDFRRDAPSAMKHWQECYRCLRELLRLVVAPPTEAERSPVALYEVKRTADFVNLKICRAAMDQPARQVRDSTPLAAPSWPPSRSIAPARAN